MANRPPESASGGRIALGIRPYLDDFAAANRAITWKVFAGVDPLLWRNYFLEQMNDPDNLIFFNLKGVDVWAGVTRAAKGRGGATDWERLQII